MIEISRTDAETNLRTDSGRAKTKAEVLYELSLAVMAGGMLGPDLAISQANKIYKSMLDSSIIYEVKN